MTRWLVPFVLFGVAAAVTAIAHDLSSRGHPATLPLDDAYIYLQYARTAVAGHPGAYAAGEPASSGATSPLWMALLTLAAAVVRLVGGDPVRSLPTAAVVFNGLAYGLALVGAYRLSRRHGAGIAGAWLAPALLVLSPLWNVGAMNGMETGLYAALLLFGVGAWAGGRHAWLVPLAWVRPEGLVVAAVLGLGWLRNGRGAGGTRDGAADASAKDSRDVRRTLLSTRRTAGVVLAVLPWLAAIALWGAPAGWAAKAFVLEPDPALRAPYTAALLDLVGRAWWFALSGAHVPAGGSFLDAVRASFTDGQSLWILLLGGGALLTLPGRRGRVPLAAWAGVTVLSLGSLAWTAHLYRYLIPAYPLLVVAATVGWLGSTWRPDGERVLGGDPESRRVPGTGTKRALARRAMGGGLAAAVLAISVLEPAHWIQLRRLYRSECERIAGNQVWTGEWIAERLPAGARVATHDVGAIAYYGERPVVDLVGLVTPALAGAYRHGEGALWEALDALPEAARPTHAAVVSAWMPYLAQTAWLGEPLWSLEANPGRLTRRFAVHPVSWPRERAGEWPGGDLTDRPGLHGETVGEPQWRVVDRLDVADLDSERTHGYRGPEASPPTVVRDMAFAPKGLPVPGAHAIEGGRVVDGSVRFTAAFDPERAARLVLRAAAPREVTLRVRAGAWEGTLTVPRGETAFREPWVELPAEVFAPEERVELTVEPVEGAAYTAFHWWLLQASE